MTRCSCCKKDLPSDDFYPDKSRSSGLASKCRPCNAKKSLEWRANNPKAAAVHARRKEMKAKYGLTLEDYDELLESQGGVCAICNKPSHNYRRLAVDHDHETGAIRGLLCDKCNRGLGYFKDNRTTLLKAIEYLENHQ